MEGEPDYRNGFVLKTKGTSKQPGVGRVPSAFRHFFIGHEGESEPAWLGTRRLTRRDTGVPDHFKIRSSVKVARWSVKPFVLVRVQVPEPFGLIVYAVGCRSFKAGKPVQVWLGLPFCPRRGTADSSVSQAEDI